MLLDAVPEIIASKVRYRGSLLTARDIFDIAAACEAGHRNAIREALAAMLEAAATARARIGRLPDVHLTSLLDRADIRPGFEHLLDEAPATARDVLTFVPRQEVTPTEKSDGNSIIPDPFTPPSPFDCD